MDRFTGGCLCGNVRIVASGRRIPGRPVSLSRLPQASWRPFSRFRGVPSEILR